MRRTRGSIGQESGQGTLEYILVLLIIVIVTLGLVYQFNDSFRIYTANYFGNYIACLLETGELPGSAACSDSYVAFDSSSGKALINGKVGGTGSGGSNSANNQNSPNAQNQAAAAAAAASRSNSGESIARGGGNTGGGPGPFPVGNTIGGPSAGPTKVGEALDKSSLPGADSLLGISPTSVSMGRFHGYDKDRVSKLPWGYFGEEEQREREADRPGKAATKKAIAGPDNSLRPKKAVQNPVREIASKTSDDAENGFSFSDYLRWLFIIIMILAILIFFGGQLQQISKSREK